MSEFGNSSNMINHLKYTETFINANDFKISRGTTWVAERFVDSIMTGGATPSILACSHRSAHKHQWSPALRPGNSINRFGSIKLLPCDFVYLRKYVANTIIIIEI